MNRWTDDGSWAVVCFDLIGFISFLFVCSSVPLCSSLFVCPSVYIFIQVVLGTLTSCHYLISISLKYIVYQLRLIDQAIEVKLDRKYTTLQYSSQRERERE